MITKEDIEHSFQRISGFANQTPLVESKVLSELINGKVFLKCENLQHTGSFKVRGALNKLMSFEKEELKKGVITASTGNHGAATAFAAEKFGTSARVFVSASAARSKVSNIERLGAKIVEFGHDPVEAENEARRVALEENVPFVSPYNDLDIVAGQGTIGFELCKSDEDFDAVLVALGGGGLISGIGSYMKQESPETEVIACSPENSKVMHDSLELGELRGNLPSKPTLSDGTAGGVEDGSVTFELCQEVIDKRYLVSEQEIAFEIREVIDKEHMLIEGAAAVPLAALRKHVDEFQGKRVAVILCGANIGSEKLAKALSMGE